MFVGRLHGGARQFKHCHRSTNTFAKCIAIAVANQIGDCFCPGDVAAARVTAAVENELEALGSTSAGH